jgi:MFS family permease
VSLLAPLGSAVLTGFDAGAIGFVLPAMRAATGAGAQQASALLSVFVAATLVAVPLAALLARRSGAALLLRGCLLLAALAGAAATWLPGVAGVLLARALQGLAHGPLLPLAAAVLVMHAPALRHGRVLGLLSLSYGLAYLAATVATPFLLQWGWRAAFALCGALALATALLPLPAGAARAPDAAPARWRLLFGRPMVVVGVLALGTGVGQAVLVWLPTVAALRVGLTPQATVLPMLALVVGGLVATALVTLRLDRLGARPLVLIGAALTLAGVLLAGAAPATLPIFTAAAAALGCGVSALCGGPLRYAAARALPVAEQGPAQGAVAWLTNVGVLAGSLLLGVLASRGDGGGRATAIAVLAAGALMALSFLAVLALPGRGAAAANEG